MEQMKEREEEKEEEKKKVERKPAFRPPRWEEKPAFEKVEVKRLSEEDYEDVIALLRRRQYELTREVKGEIKRVLGLGYSYGAYVERALVGLVLAFPVGFDPVEKAIGQGDNAVYMEEVVIALGFESKGIEERLIEEIERDHKGKYIISLVSDNPPEEDLIAWVERHGTEFAKELVRRGYSLVKHGLGLLAVKRV